jgi:ectoine hydroxylase
MTPEDILSHPARVLTTAQREAYFRDGFVTVEGAIPADWLEKLQQTSDRLLDESRGVTASNDAYDLGPEHGHEKPHVRRLRKLVDRDPVFWDFAASETSPLPDIAADLVGPGVKFHSAKLNYKWPGAGEVSEAAKSQNTGSRSTSFLRRRT